MDDFVPPKKSLQKRISTFFLGILFLLFFYFWIRFAFLQLAYEIDSINTIYVKIPKNTNICVDFSCSLPILSWLHPADFKRYQIVVIPGTSDQPYHFSRILGLPGDRIQMDSEKYFSLVRSDQEEIRLGKIEEQGKIPFGVIPENHLLLLNDSFSSNQQDSRKVGLFKKETISGKLVYVSGCPIVPFAPRVFK